MSFLNRYKILKQTNLLENATINFPRNLHCEIDKTSEIEIKKGSFQFGCTLPQQAYPSYNRPSLILEENSKIIVEGTTVIGAGCCIKVKKDATLVFKGNIYISNNFMLLCQKYIEIGSYARIGWNNTFIDHDEHAVIAPNGREVRTIYSPLIIKENVATQFNVNIPKGVTIGSNSIIATGTTLRRNVDDNSLVYANSEIVSKKGWHLPEPEFDKYEKQL